MISQEHFIKIQKLLIKNGLKYSQRNKIIKELKEILNFNQHECVLLSKKVGE